MHNELIKITLDSRDDYEWYTFEYDGMQEHCHIHNILSDCEWWLGIHVEAHSIRRAIIYSYIIGRFQENQEHETLYDIFGDK